MKWWDDRSVVEKAAITGVATAGTGAFIGAVTADRTALGAGIGAVLGAALWGVGTTAYMLWRAKKVTDKIPLL